MGFALFFNIIAVIVSTVASIILIIFTIALNNFLDRQNQCITTLDNQCKCDYDYDSSYSSDYITCEYDNFI
jgi:uncharacterized protein YxeA